LGGAKKDGIVSSIAGRLITGGSMAQRKESNDFRLERHPVLSAPHGPVVLVILDGVGVGRGDQFDAVALARTPTLTSLQETGLVTRLKAHGTAVGLPSDGDIGNSEVGHNIIGAGRVFDQGAKCVNTAIRNGAIWNGYWKEMIERLHASNGALHLIGLLSDGNVHSHEAHLEALIHRADEEGLRRVYVHILLDGRDVPDRTALVFVDRLEELLAGVRSRGNRDYWIASGGGRMVTTMDRYEADWEIVARGWRAHVKGDAEGFPSARAAIEHFRASQEGLSDQFIPPFSICDESGNPIGTINDGDAVVFFNFRGDRAIEISRAFTAGPEFNKFDRGERPNVLFAGMMLYDGDAHVPEHYLVSPPEVQKTMSEYLARNRVPQFACAETQKFGHVTYFWNGNRSGKFSDEFEKYCEIPSETVPFEQRPWMRSAETADKVIDAIRGGRYEFIRANFAGGDMVGHTGNLDATVIAIEAIDLAIARILADTARADGCLVITADHGNSEDMVERDRQGNPLYGEDEKPVFKTAHSLNPVLFIVRDFSGRHYNFKKLHEAGLSNIAATLLELMGFCSPPEFDPSLLTTG
jgi:2,3-bisphosphoglycerate-independent phosphoglycerate mutase